jgi:hypothetical protein
MLASIGIVLAGCNSKPADETKGADSGATATTGPAEVRIIKGENGPAYPDAKLTVTSPAPNQVVTGDSMMVRVDLKGVDLASPTAGEQSKGIAYSKDGQHIHVIIDDKPYMAMYKQDSFMVGGLSEGVHTLRAFPSRSWHESIKTPGAFVAHTFYVKKKTGTPVLVDGQPLLTYSRPKGDYKAEDAKQILLDFYLSNAELGADKFKVIASIDGQVKDTITEWMPYLIEGLAAGEHTVKLELVGPDGKVVPGAFNTAERKIKVLAPGEAPAAAAAPMAHDSSMKMHDSSMKMHDSAMKKHDSAMKKHDSDMKMPKGAKSGK